MYIGQVDEGYGRRAQPLRHKEAQKKWRWRGGPRRAVDLGVNSETRLTRLPSFFAVSLNWGMPRGGVGVPELYNCARGETK